MKQRNAFWRGFREGFNPMCWLAWVLFVLGHLAYLLGDRCGMPWMYRPYNWLMDRSYVICKRWDLSAPWGRNE